MRATLALIALLPLPFIPGLAQAGGLGFLTTGGLHQERVFYYDSESNSYLDNQMRPNFGTGFEAILGDRDDRMLGIARMYWLADLPPTAPADPDVPDAVYSVPTTLESVGVCTVGIKFGIWGDPVGFQVHAMGNLGSSVLTTDNLEYLVGELGGGAQYQLGDDLQLYADAMFSGRYRKHFYPGLGAYAGVRYLFD